MRATRANVAKRAGVSVATVTYVLNGTCSVKEETRRKVLTAARELCYVPDMRARSMATNRTMQLGVVVPSLMDPIDCEIIESFIHTATENGYFVNVSMKGKHIRENVRHIISQHVDGIFLLISPDDVEMDTIFTLSDSDIKIVAGMALTNEADRKQASTVQLDHRSAFSEAVNCLRHNGHRKIALLSNARPDSHEYRILPYYRQIAAQQQTPEIKFFIEDNPNVSAFEAGWNLSRKINWKAGEYTAAIVSDDRMACAMIDQLKTQGLSVPQDVSVLSLNGTDTSGQEPVVTAIVSDYNAYAEKVFQVLQNAMSGNTVEHCMQGFSLRMGNTVASV